MQSCKLLPSDDQWLEKEVLYQFNLVIWEFHSVEWGLKRPGNYFLWIRWWAVCFDQKISSDLCLYDFYDWKKVKGIILVITNFVDPESTNFFMFWGRALLTPKKSYFWDLGS